MMILNCILLPLNKMNIRYTNGLNQNINNENVVMFEMIKDDNKE